MRLLARCGIAWVTVAAAGCTGAQYFFANAPAAFGSFSRKSDLHYGEDPRQRLDVYTPDGAANRPVVVFWYGGSWTRGRKSAYRFVGAALARKGFVVVVPDYRLYPAVKFPDLLEDGAHAVAWVQQHAAEFGGDPQRIVLMGHSAGAHMASYLAFNHKYLASAGAKPEAIRGLIGLSGPYALEPNSKVLHEIFSTPYTEADWQPVRFVDAQSPPALLFHGANDDVVSVKHTEKLRDALNSLRIAVDAQIVPKRGHADTVAALVVGLGYRAPVLERSVEFIERVCASPSPSGATASISFASSQLARTSLTP